MNRPTALQTRQYDRLPVSIFRSNADVGAAAAHDGAEVIRQALAERGEANIIIATGNSQLSYIATLRAIPDLDWSKINVFLVDQYLGVDEDRLGTISFLRKHLLSVVTPRSVHPVPARPEDPEAACRDFEALLRRHPADLISLGFGENGHLAFNDPHNALFDDPVWVKVVDLSMESRQQPVSEGRFASLDEVPKQAITMTVPALLAAKHILCIVPEARKAASVKRCLEEPISEQRPGSVLRRVDNAQVYLDQESAAELSEPS